MTKEHIEDVAAGLELVIEETREGECFTVRFEGAIEGSSLTFAKDHGFIMSAIGEETYLDHMQFRLVEEWFDEYEAV